MTTPTVGDQQRVPVIGLSPLAACFYFSQVNVCRIAEPTTPAIMSKAPITKDRSVCGSKIIAAKANSNTSSTNHGKGVTGSRAVKGHALPFALLRQ
jgi:hypothetical protein